MRLLRLSALACLLAALPPPALAQSAASPVLTPLAPTVGTPIAYRISLPERWEITREDDVLTARQGPLTVVLGAMDMMKDVEDPLPVSDGEARRIMTNMIMGSDSLLYAMMREVTQEEEGYRVTGTVRDIRSLAGQRAAYLKGRYEEDGEIGWAEAHITIKDGIMYMLMFTLEGGERTEAEFATHQPLFARIRDSFVPADAPPAARPDR
jgi:hypothetical protein